MSFVAVNGLWLPVPYQSAGTTDATVTIDATTDYAAWVFEVPVTGTIDTVNIRLGTGTLTGTLSCQIQTLDSAGDPSGTAYGSSAQVDVVNPSASSAVTFSSLGCSATMGDLVAVRVWASVVTSGSCNVISGRGSFFNNANSFPYLVSRTTGTGAGTKSSSSGCIGIGYSGSVYYPITCDPPGNVTTAAVDSDSTLKRAGNRLILPARVKAIGAYFVADVDQDTTTAKLYDTDGTTVLATATLATAVRSANGSGFYQVRFDSSAEVTLSANTANPYRIVLETTNTTASSATLRIFNNSVAAAMGQLSLGTACHYTTYNTSWTDTDTARALIGLIVSEIDDGRGIGAASFNIGGLA